VKKEIGDTGAVCPKGAASRKVEERTSMECQEERQTRAHSAEVGEAIKEVVAAPINVGHATAKS